MNGFSCCRRPSIALFDDDDVCVSVNYVYLCVFCYFIAVLFFRPFFHPIFINKKRMKKIISNNNYNYESIMNASLSICQVNECLSMMYGAV